MDKVKKYAKFVVAVAGAVVVLGNQVAAGHVEIEAVIALLVAAGVYRVPNK